MKPGERKCSIEGCSNIYQARGLCAKHYQNHLYETGRLGSRKNKNNMGLRHLTTARGEKPYKRLYGKTEIIEILDYVDAYIKLIKERKFTEDCVDAEYTLERVYEHILEKTQ